MIGHIDSQRLACDASDGVLLEEPIGFTIHPTGISPALDFESLCIGSPKASLEVAAIGRTVLGALDTTNNQPRKRKHDNLRC